MMKVKPKVQNELHIRIIISFSIKPYFGGKKIPLF